MCEFLPCFAIGSHVRVAQREVPGSHDIPKGNARALLRGPGAVNL